jgi:hypothetical protein
MKFTLFYSKNETLHIPILLLIKRESPPLRYSTYIFSTLYAFCVEGAGIK